MQIIVRYENGKSTFSSNKNVQDVSECILYGWQEKRFLTGPRMLIFNRIKMGKPFMWMNIWGGRCARGGMKAVVRLNTTRKAKDEIRKCRM
jgi:hypothetical protein